MYVKGNNQYEYQGMKITGFQIHTYECMYVCIHQVLNNWRRLAKHCSLINTYKYIHRCVCVFIVHNWPKRTPTTATTNNGWLSKTPHAAGCVRWCFFFSIDRQQEQQQQQYQQQQQHQTSSERERAVQSVWLKCVCECVSESERLWLCVRTSVCVCVCVYGFFTLIFFNQLAQFSQIN